MGLYKQGKSSIWWMNFSIKNKQYRRSTGTADKKLAELILAKARVQVVEGKWFEEKEEAAEYTFDELADKYEKWMQGRYKSEFKIHLIRQLKERFKRYPLTMIDMYELEKLQSDKLKAGRYKKKVDGKLITVPNKPATVNRFIAVIAHMFTKAADWKMIDRAAIPKVKMLKENNKRLRYLSKEECHELTGACDTHLKPIVITALNTGMRRSEILGLTWDRVDLKHGFILLDKTKSGERREIPINGTLRELFKNLPRHIAVPYVFYDPSNGKPYKAARKSFVTACRKTKIVDFHFHDLRHTFASQLVMAGVDITTVKELLGHADIKMTLRYAHLAPSHKIRALEIYDNVLNVKESEYKLQDQTNYHKFIIPADERKVEGL